MRNCFLFLLLGIVFFACQKDNDTAPENKKACRLTKIIPGPNNEVTEDSAFTFTYDSEGILTKITEENFGKTYDYILHYDGQNRLLKIEGMRETEFVYNSKGLLSEMRYSKLSANIKLIFEYGADSVPFLAREYWLSAITGWQWKEQTEYRYAYQNGNIVSVEMFYSGGSTRKHNFEYYDYIPNNKRLSLIDMNYHGLGFYEHFCYFNKNMLKKGDWQGHGYYNFDYTIDSGNIVKSTHTWHIPNTNDSARDIRFYFYECK